MNEETYLAAKDQLYNASNFTLFSLMFLIIVIILMLSLSREKLLPLFILSSIMLPMSSRLVLAGVNLFFLRIIVMVLLARLILKSEFHIQYQPIDKLLFYWAASMILLFVLRERTLSAIINRVGWCITVIGSYLIFRCLIKKVTDFDLALKVIGIASIIIASSMLFEYFSGKNLFYWLGNNLYTMVDNEGNRRCNGPFSHPISAGIFGATQLPLLVYLVRINKFKMIALFGIFASIVITFTSASSTSYLSFALALGGMSLWPFRKYSRTFFWTGIGVLVLLHLLMNAPVWALIARAAVFGGSTAYHRFLLIDQFIYRFNEWWLWGTKSTAHWAHMGVQLWDVSNYIVRIGVDGGFLSVILFVVFLLKILSSLNRSLLNDFNSKELTMLNWGITVSISTHILAFIGFSYWDQIFISLYFLFAACLSIFSNSKKYVIIQRNSKK